jgi:hypothetical protein
MDDANLVEKLDLKHSCFGKALLLEWGNGRTCCHACFTEYGQIEIFLKIDFMSITRGPLQIASEEDRHYTVMLCGGFFSQL